MKQYSLGLKLGGEEHKEFLEEGFFFSSPPDLFSGRITSQHYLRGVARLIMNITLLRAENLALNKDKALPSLEPRLKITGKPVTKHMM